MIYIVFLLLFTCGLLTTLNISRSFSGLEYLAYAFPIGFGVWSFFMLGADVMGVDVGAQKYVWSILMLANVIPLGRLWLKDVNIASDLKKSFISNNKNTFEFLSNPLKINLTYLFMMGICIFVIGALSIKSLYWPVINYDSIDGFDLLAKLIYQEGTLNSSVFAGDNPMYTVRSLYPPLLVHALSLTYIFEVGSSKIISVIYLISVVLAVYAFILKENSHFLAAIGIFVMCVTPVYISFGAITSSNTVCALYVFIGLAGYDRWLRHSEKHYFILATICLCLAVWTRSEAIIFAFVVGVSLLYQVWKKKNYKDLFLYSTLTLLPFIVWQVYLKTVLQVNSAQPIITHLYWDSEKFSNLMKQINIVVSNAQLFSFSIKLFLLLAVLNIVFFFKEKRTLLMTSLLFSSFALFVLLYYQLDTDYKVYTNGGWIGSGLKRGLFYFIPIGCYYIANSFVMKKLFS